MKTEVLFFAIAIVIAKAISGMEIGFLIAITMMTIGAVVATEKTKSGIIVLTGTMALFFNLFKTPLPPQAFPIVYAIITFLVLLMALSVIIVLAEKETGTETRVEFGHTPTRRKAITA